MLDLISKEEWGAYSIIFQCQEIPALRRIYPAKTQEEMLEFLHAYLEREDQHSRSRLGDDQVKHAPLGNNSFEPASVSVIEECVKLTCF